MMWNFCKIFTKLGDRCKTHAKNLPRRAFSSKSKALARQEIARLVQFLARRCPHRGISGNALPASGKFLQGIPDSGNTLHDTAQSDGLLPS